LLGNFSGCVSGWGFGHGLYSPFTHIHYTYHEWGPIDKGSFQIWAESESWTKWVWTLEEMGKIGGHQFVGM